MPLAKHMPDISELLKSPHENTAKLLNIVSVKLRMRNFKAQILPYHRIDDVYKLSETEAKKVILALINQLMALSDDPDEWVETDEETKGLKFKCKVLDSLPSR